MAKAKKKKTKKQEVCSCCGRCPICGTRPNDKSDCPFQPYYYWSSSITTSDNDIPLTLADACANT